MVPSPTPASPGTLLDMQILGPHRRLTRSSTSDLLFNKPCKPKFENCCSISKEMLSNLFIKTLEIWNTFQDIKLIANPVPTASTYFTRLWGPSEWDSVCERYNMLVVYFWIVRSPRFHFPPHPSHLSCFSLNAITSKEPSLNIKVWCLSLLLSQHPIYFTSITNYHP